MKKTTGGGRKETRPFLDSHEKNGIRQLPNQNEERTAPSSRKGGPAGKRSASCYDSNQARKAAVRGKKNTGTRRRDRYRNGRKKGSALTQIVPVELQKGPRKGRLTQHGGKGDAIKKKRGEKAARLPRPKLPRDSIEKALSGGKAYSSKVFLQKKTDGCTWRKGVYQERRSSRQLRGTGKEKKGTERSRSSQTSRRGAGKL